MPTAWQLRAKASAFSWILETHDSLSTDDRVRQPSVASVRRPADVTAVPWSAPPPPPESARQAPIGGRDPHSRRSPSSSGIARERRPEPQEQGGRVATCAADGHGSGPKLDSKPIRYCAGRVPRQVSASRAADEALDGRWPLELPKQLPHRGPLAGCLITRRRRRAQQTTAKPHTQRIAVAGACPGTKN